MKTVYVLMWNVEEGEDPSIEGVYNTSEEAKAAVEQIHGWPADWYRCNDIMEMEFMAHATIIKTTLYGVL